MDLNLCTLCPYNQSQHDELRPIFGQGMVALAENRRTAEPQVEATQAKTCASTDPGRTRNQTINSSVFYALTLDLLSKKGYLVKSVVCT